MTEAQNLIDEICKNEQDTESVWLTLDNMCIAEMQELIDEIKLLQKKASNWDKYEKECEQISATHKLMVERNIINTNGSLSEYQKQLIEDANKWRDYWKIAESIRKEEYERTPTMFDAIRKELE